MTPEIAIIVVRIVIILFLTGIFGTIFYAMYVAEVRYDKFCKWAESDESKRWIEYIVQQACDKTLEEKDILSKEEKEWLEEYNREPKEPVKCFELE